MTERSYLKFKLAILIVALVLAIAFIVFSINGSFDFMFNGRFIKQNDFLGADAAEISENERYEFENIKEIEISTANVEIEIDEHDLNSVILSFSGDADMKYEVDDYELNIIQNVNSFKNFGSESGVVRVLVPKDSMYSYELDSISGSIILRNKNAEKISVDSTSGSIEIFSSVEKEIKIDNVSGKIEIHEPSPKISIDTISGKSTLIADENTEEVEVDSVSGGVIIKLKGIDEISAKLETVSGKITVNGNISTINNNEPIINANTISGNLQFINAD